MQYKTLGVLKSEILMESDTELEDFIQAPEVVVYFKDAVREAAAHIHKLGLEDDYFLTSTTASLVLNQRYVPLPTDIYASKIRGFTYTYGGRIYPVRRLKGKDRFELAQELRFSPGGNQPYRYQLMNSSPSIGARAELFPLSYETSPDCLFIDYIRAPIDPVNDASLIDIPEFYSFVKAYVKMKIFGKEGSAFSEDAKGEYTKELNLMLATLNEMVPDYDSEIPPDLSTYEEHS